MSNTSDRLENAILDHMCRSATWSPPATLYLALYTAAPSDAGGGTEVTGGSYVRKSLTTGDTLFEATQGGTTGASSGTTNQSKNAAAIAFVTPTADWGDVTHWALHDHASADQPQVWGAFSSTWTINSGNTVQIDAQTLIITVTGTNYFANKMLDCLLRARAWTKPTGLAFDLYTVAPTDAGGGTLVTGGSYAAATVTPGDTVFTASQGGTTGASTGTSGSVGNAAAITWPAPTANWGAVLAEGLKDQAGNLLRRVTYSSTWTINSGNPAPQHGVGECTVTMA